MKVNLVGISPCSIKTFPPHIHNDWEIVLNFQGEGISLINNKEYTFYPGTIICQPPNVPHAKISKTNFKDIYMRVHGFVKPDDQDVPVFTDDEEKSFENLMLFALRVFHKKDFNYVSILESIFETMYQLLLSWSKSELKNPEVELYKNILIENFTDPEFGISDAMKKMSYCSDYFRRQFNKYTGITPKSYLTNLRIEHAKKLLRQKSSLKATISEVSFLSGFYDPHYFSRVFKDKVGVTPQAYKNSY